MPSDSSSTALFPLLQEIEIAARDRLYLLAVVCSLSLPDICVRLELENWAKASQIGAKYKEWCSRNLPTDFLKPADLWRLRCKLVHEGKLSGLNAEGIRRIVLVPENPCVSIKNCQLGDAYTYDAKDFCLVITDGVKRWLKNNESNEIVQKNLNNLLQYRRDGMVPYVVGLPVIV